MIQFRASDDIRKTIDDFGQKKWVDDFEQKYLRPLVFEKKRDKGNKNEHYVAQLRELAIINNQNYLTEEEIDALLNSDAGAEYLEILDGSSNVLKKLGNIENINKDYIKREELKKLINLSDEDVDSLFTIIQKPSNADAVLQYQNYINGQTKIKNFILEDIKQPVKERKIKDSKGLKNNLKNFLGITENDKDLISKYFKFPPETVGDESIKEIEKILNNILMSQEEYFLYQNMASKIRTLDDVEKANEILTKVPNNEEKYLEVRNEVKKDIKEFLLYRKDGAYAEKEKQSEKLKSKVKLLMYSESTLAKLKNGINFILHKADKNVNAEKLNEILNYIKGCGFKDGIENMLWSEDIKITKDEFKSMVLRTGYESFDGFEKLYNKIKNKNDTITYKTRRKEFTSIIAEIAYTFGIIYNTENPTALQIRKWALLLEYHIEAAGELAELLASHEDFIESTYISFSSKWLDFLAVCRKSLAHQPLEINKSMMEYVVEKLILDTSLRVEEANDIKLSEIISKVWFQKHKTVSIKELEKNKIEIFLNVEGLGFKDDFKIFHKNFNCDIGNQRDVCLVVNSAYGQEISHFNLLELELRLSRILNANVHVYHLKELINGNSRLKIDKTYALEIIKYAKTLEQLIIESKFAKIFENQRWTAVNIPNVGRLDTTDYMERKDIETILHFIFGNDVTFSDLTINLNPERLREFFLLRFAEFNKDKSNSLELSKIITLLLERIILPCVLKYRATNIPVGQSLKYKQHIFIPFLQEPLKQEGRFLPGEYPTLISPLRSPDNPNFVSMGTYSIWNDDNSNSFPSDTKILTVKELWEYNDEQYKTRGDPRGITYEYYKAHNMALGEGVLLQELADGSIIIHYQGHNVSLSPQEMDLLYIKKDAHVGGYRRFDFYVNNRVINRISKKKDLEDLEGLAKYFAKILLYNKDFITKVLDPIRKIDVSIFAGATSIEHMRDTIDLKHDHENIKEFRNNRLKNNAYLTKIITEKSRRYIDSLVQVLKQEKNNAKLNLVAEMTKIDKEINQKLYQYYLDNQAEILSLDRMQNQQQRQISAYLSSNNKIEMAVRTKEDFYIAVRNNPSILRDEKLKKEIMKLLEVRADFLDKLRDIFVEERKTSLPSNAKLPDNNFIQQFSKILKKHLVGDVVTYDGLMLIEAYKYYKKLSLILEPILNPKIIDLLFSKRIDMDSVYKLIDIDLQTRFTDGTNSNVIFNLNEIEKELTQLDYASEIEACLLKEKKTAYKHIEQHRYWALIKTHANIEIEKLNISINPEENIFSNYKVPGISNGIVGFKSELDRELSAIHGQIASHFPERKQSDEPSILIENIPSVLWAANNIQGNYSGEITGASVFKLDVKTLDELMNFHGWSEEEKIYHKQHYELDDDRIKKYYEFRELYDLLSISASRTAEYSRCIIQYFNDFEGHLNKKRAFEAYLLKSKLELYIIAYENHLEEQKKLINAIMATEFVKKRIYDVFMDPLSIQELLTFLDGFEVGEMLDETIKNNVIYILQEIKKQVQNELMEKTNLKLIKDSSQIKNIKEKLATASRQDLPTEIQNNSKELEISLEYSDAMFGHNDGQMIVAAEDDDTIRVSLDPIPGEPNYVESQTQSQASINSEDAKTIDYSSLSNSANQETIAGAFASINFPGGVQIAENTINPPRSGEAHTGASININQTGGPSISSGGIHYSFSRGCENLTWASQRAAALVTKPLVYAYKNSGKIKHSLYKLAEVVGKEGTIKCLRAAARASRCSPDGASRL